MKGKGGNSDYVELIRRVRDGDDGAMTLLIGRFQDVAVGMAYSWVKDPELAKDIAQEAFLDAYVNLSQLREPKAFPAWFRQVVMKHCDRVTRRRSADGTTAQTRNGEEGPEARAASAQEADHLRLAIAALAMEQRQVVALQYFAELTGPEIADFLQLPLSTVKKRLRLARRSLRDQSENLMKETLQAMRPSNSAQFSEEIQFFIAMRKLDLPTVTRMLEQRPELANVQQQWDSAIVYERILPFASMATALITAVELDSLPMARALLDAGADPNGPCGCDTAEPPLWTAALLNRVAHVDLLLARGADPNVRAAAGNTPLHIAAMRDYQRISQRLLAGGADPGVLDDSRVPDMPLVTWSPLPKPRRTPAQWASMNHKRDDARALAMRIVEGASRDMLETGIKAVDFFAPVPLGGLVRINFAAGVGMLLLISELIWRFSEMQDSQVVWTGFTQPPFDRRQFEAEMAEFGIADRITSSIADCDEPADRRRAAFANGLEQVAAQVGDGRHVLAIVLSTEGFENDVDASLPLLKAMTGNGSATTLVVTPFRREALPLALSAPFDVEITLDRRRALQRLYPSIHPARTFSNAAFSNDQIRLRKGVDESFAQHDAGDPSLEAHAVNRLFEFFSQALKVAEPFGGAAAERVGVQETLRQIEALLNAG